MNGHEFLTGSNPPEFIFVANKYTIPNYASNSCFRCKLTRILSNIFQRINHFTLDYYFINFKKFSKFDH